MAESHSGSRSAAICGLSSHRGRVTLSDELKRREERHRDLRSTSLTPHEISEADAKQPAPQKITSAVLGWLIVVALILAFLGYIFF